MNFEPGIIALAGIFFLLVMLGAAWATEKGIISRKLVHHPAIYVLSLGIYASSWSFYGSVGITAQDGYAFLSIYFGISGAFLLAPVLLTPILKITSSYQLSSLPDLFAFRFRSRAAGTFSTLLLVGISLPLMALQIQATAESTEFLLGSTSEHSLVITYCIIIIFFTLFFGTRHLSGRKHHHGLVFAMAVGALMKLGIMLLLGMTVLFQVFDGPPGLNQWIEQNPMISDNMGSKLDDGPWRTLLLMFFASAIATPHMFHMTFAENRDSQFLQSASWGLPFYLLLLSFSTPLILWAGIQLGAEVSPEFYSLAIGQQLQKPWLSLLVYVGGLCAASGIMVITTLALSSMLMNHLILPVYPPSLTPVNIDIFRWLTNIKQGVVILMITSSYLLYRLLENGTDIHQLGIVAYAGAMQLLPGTLCTLYWKKVNRHGFIAGLAAGTATWFITLLLPTVTGITITPFQWQDILSLSGSDWHLAATASLIANCLALYLVSRLTTMSNSEKSAAHACLVNPKSTDSPLIPVADSAIEFKEMLSKPLGADIAQAQVSKALNDLKLQPDEHRPLALRRLRDRIESNLSGLLGPSVAHEIVENHLPLDDNRGYASMDIHFIESQMEAYRSRLTGLAAELDGLRRYHRETLQNLPMAVCSIENTDNNNHEILLWNQAMSALTGIPSEDVLGHQLAKIPAPWNTLIGRFLESDENHLNKHKLEINGTDRYFNLHKAHISSSRKDQVMMLEDQTEEHMMEEQLFHNERLASIGQLAAGVAHEIGNPITGIDCLAQEMKFISDNPDVQTSSEQILQQTKRVTRIVQTLVTYAHNGQRKNDDLKESLVAAVDLHTCVDEAISLLKLSQKHDKIAFHNQCNPDHQISGNSQKLQQVFINLFSNASDATPDHGRVTITSYASEMTITIEIEDQGDGIPDAVQERLFEPFFTTKEAGKGTGLGLALTWNIIKEHFGSIQVVSPADTVLQKGARFIIALPRYEPEAQTTPLISIYQGVTV